MEEGLKVLEDVKTAFNCPVLTDVHGPEQCAPAAEVVDVRSLPQMAQTGYPVIMDCTHSVAQPGGKGTASGGQREFAPVMARAAVAIGVAGLFIETHQDPDNAPSDGPNMIRLDQMDALLTHLVALDELTKSNPVTLS